MADDSNDLFGPTPDKAKPTLTELGYIAEVTANAECPFCRNTEWAYAANADGTPWHSLGNFMRDGKVIALPAITLSCKKCGLIRHHDLAMVRVNMQEGGNNG